MNKKSLVLIALIGFISFTINRDSAKEFAEMFTKQTIEQSSKEYDVHYRMKYFSSDDTLDFYANCRIIRHEEDTIFGSSIWIDNDSIEYYYNLEYLYFINHKQKQITRYLPHQGQTGPITSSTVGAVRRTFFVKPQALTEYVVDTSIEVDFLDTIVNEESCKLIQLDFQDDESFTNKQMNLLFNPNKQIKDIAYSVKFQNEWQYNNWKILRQSYNTINDKQLKNEFEELLKRYKIEDYKPRSQEEMQPLDNGSEAPKFKGFNYQSKDSVAFSDYEGKVLIIDFWYKDCFPCIKAIPFLSGLRNKYAEEELAVLGFNPYDWKKESKKSKLDEFIQINEMNYPAIFVDQAVTESYNVFAYPTFYIVDQAGQIVFSQRGYSEDNDSKVDSVVAEIIGMEK